MTSPSDGAPLAAPECLSSFPEGKEPPDIAVANVAPRVPSLRSVPEQQNSTIMTPSSTPLGALNAARRPVPVQQQGSSIRTGGLTQDMQAKMKAFHLSRQGAPPPKGPRHASESAVPHSISTSNIQADSGQPAAGITGVLASPVPTTPVGPLVGGAAGLRLPPNARPQAHNWASSPAAAGLKINPKQSLGARRGLKLPGGLPGSSPSASPIGGSNGQDKSFLGSAANEANGNVHGAPLKAESGSLFTKFSDFVDTKNGTLKFAGKAVIHGKGIDFSSGSSFSISLDEVESLDELGKGNYGTVYKVRHSRPPMRRPGMGLVGNRQSSILGSLGSTTSTLDRDVVGGENQTSRPKDNTTSVIMAMKEIRLELDEAKFAAIIMELDVLHRCLSPFIIDFYGAFFQEGAVYICMEYMDGGSIDKLYGDGIPEAILRKITLSTVMGLKTLKEEHNIIHRDVKPTNILANSRGQIKICDFGVSGNLVASIAKTNIGCQSYMAPERITSGGIAQAGANPGGGTYSAQSDIWSLGLSIIECAMGRYPYPPETYGNIFSQLSVCSSSISILSVN
jgi:mitogen-activated protein kinase kinase